MKHNLNRFILAQEKSYEVALSEIKSGQKKSHWIWYIFPQIKGLGFSENAIFYEIKSKEEAQNYLKDSILGERLKEISGELLNLNENNPTKILGYPDDLKLKSSMTLFSIIDETKDNVFNKVLEKFYEGITCQKTISILKQL